MVKIRYEQKPYRKTMMKFYGADVYPSPSRRTSIGNRILEEHPDRTDSLGISKSEEHQV